MVAIVISLLENVIGVSKGHNVLLNVSIKYDDNQFFTKSQYENLPNVDCYISVHNLSYG